MQITIECLTGSMAGKAFNFDQAEITLGRGEHVKKDIDFADTDIGVSRNHGSLVVRDNRIYLNDQSRAGTTVRGQRVQGTTYELQSEDELQLGGQSGPKLRVRFQLVASPQVAEASTPPPQSSPAQPTVIQAPSATPEPQVQPVLQGQSTVIQAKQSISPIPTPPQLSSETMMQPAAASDATLFQAPAPIQQNLPSSDATVSQANDATLFQMPPMPSADATLFQPSGETMLQRPQENNKTLNQAQSVDTSRTVFQEDRRFPWVPTIVLGLLVVGVVGFLVWFFLPR